MPKVGKLNQKHVWQDTKKWLQKLNAHASWTFEEIQIPPRPRLGNVVIEAKDLTKGFDDRILIDKLSFSLPKNGIVGVI